MLGGRPVWMRGSGPKATAGVGSRVALLLELYGEIP